MVTQNRPIQALEMQTGIHSVLRLASSNELMARHRSSMVSNAEYPVLAQRRSAGLFETSESRMRPQSVWIGSFRSAKWLVEIGEW